MSPTIKLEALMVEEEALVTRGWTRPGPRNGGAGWKRGSANRGSAAGRGSGAGPLKKKNQRHQGRDHSVRPATVSGRF